MSSLDQNPPNANQNITSGATDWLWTVFAIMLVSFFAIIIWSFARPRGTRLFHNIAIVILATASLAYFSMASDLGATPIQVEFNRGRPGTRQIWYVRYIQYFINFPLLLLLLLLLTGLSLSDVLITTFFGWVVVVSGLVGALVHSSYKWGYYAFGVTALICIWFILIFYAPKTSFAAGPSARSEFNHGAAFIVFMTFLYPIAWACCEGANVISPTREMIWYGIFDIVTGPLFLFNYVFGLRRIEFNSFGLRSGKTREQAALTEKPGETSGQSAISTNGVPGSGRAAGGASGTGVTGTNSGPVLGAEAVAAP